MGAAGDLFRFTCSPTLELTNMYRNLVTNQLHFGNAEIFPRRVHHLGKQLKEPNFDIFSTSYGWEGSRFTGLHKLSQVCTQEGVELFLIYHCLSKLQAKRVFWEDFYLTAD